MAGIIDKLKCRISGHKRGKRIATINDGGVWDAKHAGFPCAQIECPRCTATWTRKVKAA